MNVSSIKINKVYEEGEVDLDKLLPEAVEGLEVVEGLVENVTEHESEIAGLIANENVLGAKNLLPLTLDNLKTRNTSGTWEDNTYTLNGVTFTVNTDTIGNVTNITVNGTASANTQLNLTNNIPNNFIGCRLNGSPIFDGNISILVSYFQGNTWKAEQHSYNGAESIISLNYPNVIISIYVASGVTTSNQVFKPMIRLATETDATYRPYAMGNQELTQRLLSLEARVTALEG